MYICVRVFECVRDREAERGSAGQKWREESAGIEREGRNGQDYNMRVTEREGEKAGFDRMDTTSTVSLFYAIMIKYTLTTEESEPCWLERR